jgi:N-acetylneuraminic acid mutarotase
MKTTLLSVLLVFAALVSSGQWSYTNLFIPREYMGGAAIGSKVYFAGGSNDDGFWSIVEEFNLITQEMTLIGPLSVPRQLIGGTTTCGSKIFFAGGFDWVSTKNVVDIYDTQTQQWSVEQLSIDRLSIAAVSHGSKVLFAGGFQYPAINRVDIVDIYNTITGEWTTDYLSQPREGIASAVVGDLAIFAGGITNAGFTDRVDIYNFSDSTWSQATLSEARGYASATTIGNKVIIGGGVTSFYNPTNVVDIYDASDGSWTTSNLTIPRSAINNAATVNGKAYFVGGGTFTGSGFTNPQNIIDIYDEASDIWTTDTLAEPLIHHSVLGIDVGFDNYMVVAGGKNDLGEIVSKIEIFYDPETGISPKPDEDAIISIYPNPCNNFLTINTPNGVIIDVVVIYNQTGQKVLQGKLVNSTLDISTLHQGMYIIELKTDQGKVRKKLTVQ